MGVWWPERNVNIENFHLGSGAEEMVLKDMRNESGEDLPFGDRRQELVFIGIKLSIDAIQNTLDSVSYFLYIVLFISGETLNRNLETGEMSYL